jgi:hypothetical protein
MRKIFVNGDTANVRTLSPFAYKDTIKTLDKSNEARVEVDGKRVFRSAVTSGRDVKSGAAGMKYHLYFYATEDAAVKRDTARREFLPLSAEEFRAYKQDPGYIVVIASATGLEKPPVAAEPPTAEPETVAEQTEGVPVVTKRKAKR